MKPNLSVTKDNGRFAKSGQSAAQSSTGGREDKEF